MIGRVRKEPVVMSDYKKEFHEQSKEVKKAFTFTNLEVDLPPEKIVDVDHPYLYVPQYQANAILPSNNPYDFSITEPTIHGRLYDHILGGNTEANPNQYNALIYDLERSISDRIVSNICQNITIIYKDGFENVISPFIKEKDNNNINFRPYYPTSDIRPMSNWIDLFRIRPSIGSYEKGELIQDLRSNEAMMNMLRASRDIMSKVSNNYDRIIANLVENDKFDVDEFTKAVLRVEGIDIETIDPSAYTAIAINALNNIACNDIKKISEIVEISITQGTAEFYRRKMEILHQE